MNKIWPLALLLLAAACSRGGTDLSKAPLAGARIGGPFALTNQDGRIVHDGDFAGRYRIVYFGYTFCPDVCPTDMQEIGMGLKLFEKQDAAAAARVVPIFISVDPARDTPKVLKEFVANFHPRMVGLTGSEAAIDRVATEFGVYHTKGAVTANGGYLVQHSRAAYLMGPEGQPIALLPLEGSDAPQQIAATLATWVR